MEIFKKLKGHAIYNRWHTLKNRVQTMSLLHHHFYDDEMLEKQDSSIVSFSKEDCYETNCIGELMAPFFWHTTVCSLQLHIYLAASTEKTPFEKSFQFLFQIPER